MNNQDSGIGNAGQPFARSFCSATIELANGETVTPCHRPKEHDGDHEGYCLGSKAVWAKGQLADDLRQEIIYEVQHDQPAIDEPAANNLRWAEKELMKMHNEENDPQLRRLWRTAAMIAKDKCTK